MAESLTELCGEIRSWLYHGQKSSSGLDQVSAMFQKYFLEDIMQTVERDTCKYNPRILGIGLRAWVPWQLHPTQDAAMSKILLTLYTTYKPEEVERVFNIYRDSLMTLPNYGPLAYSYIEMREIEKYKEEGTGAISVVLRNIPEGTETVIFVAYSMVLTGYEEMRAPDAAAMGLLLKQKADVAKESLVQYIDSYKITEDGLNHPQRQVNPDRPAYLPIAQQRVNHVDPNAAHLQFRMVGGNVANEEVAITNHPGRMVLRPDHDYVAEAAANNARARTRAEYQRAAQPAPPPRTYMDGMQRMVGELHGNAPMYVRPDQDELGRQAAADLLNPFINTQANVADTIRNRQRRVEEVMDAFDTDMANIPDRLPEVVQEVEAVNQAARRRRRGRA